jgi:hypothetical protein
MERAITPAYTDVVNYSPIRSRTFCLDKQYICLSTFEQQLLDSID